VPPPVPLPVPSSLTSSLACLGRPPASAGGMERVGDLLKKAKTGQLTQEDAFELGTSLAVEAQSPRRIR
jgi:hypothetical protein